MAKAAPADLVERVTQTILVIRGEKVLLDEHLAALYGVPTKVLVQSVKRHAERFPADFMFQLSDEEWDHLRSQIVTSSSGSGGALGSPRGSSRVHGGRRYAPFVFTEQGVAMLSGVLRSERAVQVNIEIMRAFVRLRELLASHQDLARKLAALERRYDAQFRAVFEAIRDLMAPPTPRKKPIGFRRGTP